jgi:hypothetical protein
MSYLARIAISARTSEIAKIGKDGGVSAKPARRKGMMRPLR